MTDTIKEHALNSTAHTQIPDPRRDARDEQVNQERATGIFNLRPEMKDIIERLALTDPIIYMVWNHYVNEKKTYPVAAHQIKYFWEKVAAELQTAQEDITKATRSMHA